jgi:hypothetical protein
MGEGRPFRKVLVNALIEPNPPALVNLRGGTLVTFTFMKPNLVKLRHSRKDGIPGSLC